MKPDAVEGKYGSELVTIDCKDIKLQLQEDDLVIGTRTRKALKKLTPWPAGMLYPWSSIILWNCCQ